MESGSVARRAGVAAIAVALLAAATALLWWRAGAARPARPIDHTRRASVLAVNFKNFGKAPKAEHVFHESGDPGDPVRSYFWTDVSKLEAAVLEVFAEAQRRGLDGTRQETGRKAALDLIFASTHSARPAVRGPDGIRVAPDRSQPSPARAGMLAVFTKLAESHIGRFPRVRVQTVFLLNCGSVQDSGDARTLDRAVRAMTGAPPARILSTSDKVNPDYRDICAGFATGNPITIYDSRPGGPNGTEPRAVPWLEVGRDGTFNFATGEGRNLAVHAR